MYLIGQSVRAILRLTSMEFRLTFKFSKGKRIAYFDLQLDLTVARCYSFHLYILKFFDFAIFDQWYQ